MYAIALVVLCLLAVAFGLVGLYAERHREDHPAIRSPWSGMLSDGMRHAASLGYSEGEIAQMSGCSRKHVRRVLSE